jgi:NADH-quinone oxidoreductase subunit C
MNPTEIEDLLQSRIAATRVWSAFRDQHQVVVDSSLLLETLRVLRDEADFDMLVDLTAVDYLEFENARRRFGVVYNLLSTQTGSRLIVKTFLDEPTLTLPSAVNLWGSADWMEREVYDMFGIRFEGRPDLKRLLLPEEYTSFPLRKDYPVKGRGERHNFPVITRAQS